MTRKQKFEELMNRNPGLPLELLEEVVRDWEEIEKESKMDSLVFPFDSQEFLDIWNYWKQVKKEEHNFRYKSKISEQAALKKVMKLSEGNEQTAIEIIMQSIENGWKGFFKLKEDGRKEKRVTDDYKQSILNDLYSD